jgi:hypothetical protein
MHKWRFPSVSEGHEELEVDEDATWPTLTEQLNLKEAMKDGCRRYSWCAGLVVQVSPI